jgi:predicted  nucleic acid-binding Zn-ribbon protein
LYLKKKKHEFLFLKKSKADLDRQRAKGPNHNPTKVSFIENQIRQYEQQLSDIKRRVDFIEVKQKFFSFLNYNNSF